MDGKGVLLDAQTGAELERFQLPLGKYWGMALSPDGRTLAAVGDDRALLWDMAERRQRRSLEGTLGRLQGIAFSHDGKTLAVGSEATGTIWVFEVARGRLVDAFHGQPRGVFSVAFSPDDRMLASCCGDGSVRIWDVAMRRLQTAFRAHDSRAWCLAISADGRTLASCGQDGGIHLRGCWSEREKITIPVPDHTVCSMIFAPNGHQATLFGFKGRDGVIEVLDLDQGTLRESRRIRGTTDIFHGVLSPDGMRLATATYNDTITVWNLEDGLPQQVIPFPYLQYLGPGAGKRIFGDLAFSPDGRLIAVNDIGMELYLLDTEGRVRGRYAEWNLARFKFFPAGDAVILYNVNGLLRGNVTTGESLKGPVWAHTSLEALALSDDGLMMATGGREGAIQLWNPTRIESQGILLGHRSAVTGLAISPDRKVIASHSPGDRTVRLWDIATLQELAEIDENIDDSMTLSFSPDGSTLVGYGGDFPRCQVTLWRSSHDMPPGE